MNSSPAWVLWKSNSRRNSQKAPRQRWMRRPRNSPPSMAPKAFPRSPKCTSAPPCGRKVCRNRRRSNGGAGPARPRSDYLRSNARLELGPAGAALVATEASGQAGHYAPSLCKPHCESSRRARKTSGPRPVITQYGLIQIVRLVRIFHSY